MIPRTMSLIKMRIIPNRKALTITQHMRNKNLKESTYDIFVEQSLTDFYWSG